MGVELFDLTFILSHSIWMLSNWVKLPKGNDTAAAKRKETFPATSKSSPCPATSILRGNHPQGRGERCCFLFTRALRYPSLFSVHLCPPLPFQHHNINPLTWCNLTLPPLIAFSFIHPRFDLLILCHPFFSPIPQLQPHRPPPLPH